MVFLCHLNQATTAQISSTTEYIRQENIPNTTWYIRPENPPNTTCPGLPCETLDYYANVSHVNNTQFIFLSGVHKLRTNFTLCNLLSIQLVGSDTEEHIYNSAYPTPQVHCNATSSAGFIFQNVSSLTIKNLSIVYCGQMIPKTVYNVSLPVQAAVAMKQVSTLTMHSVTVQNSSGYGLVAEGLYDNSNISNCVFLYNTGNGRYYIGGNVAIMYKHCPAKYTLTKNNVSILSSTIMYGNTSHATDHTTELESKVQATGLVIHVSCTNVFVLVSDVTLGHNEAHGNSSKGGNLHISFYNTSHHINNSIVIENSKILNGVAVIGGGVYIKYFFTGSKTRSKTDFQACENKITFRNTNFTGNSGSMRGGAMHLLFVQSEMVEGCPRGQVTIERCYFSDNVLHTTTADVGVAINIFMFFINGVVSTSLPYYTVHIKESHFVRNALITKNNQNRISGGAVLYVGKHRREIFITDSTFEDNEITAISAFRSNVVFQGNITIRNNTGIDGGGLILCEASYMLLSPYTNVTFENNTALHFGGAIYAEDQCLDSEPLCFYQIYQQKDNSHSVMRNGGANGYGSNLTVTTNTEQTLNFPLDTIHVIMINNTAKFAGSQIYGGSMDYCYAMINANKTFTGTLYGKIFNESLWKYNNKTDLSYVTSYPRYVCFCNGKNQTMCHITTLLYEYEIFPGESITVSIAAVGQFENTVPASITANSTNTTYKTIHAECTNISFTVNSDKPSEILTILILSNKGYTTNTKVEDQNSSFTGRNTRFVRIYFKDCPRGIAFRETTKTCNVSEKMWRNGYKYNAENQTLSRPGGVWIGTQSASNASDRRNHHFNMFDNCPMDYCNHLRTKIMANETYFDEDSQCVDNRQGTLCGACRPPYSVAIASDKCLKCDFAYPKSYLSLLALGYFAISFITNALLIAFNVTITDGTVNGFLFYASIFQINRQSFIHRPTHDTFFTEAIAWMNLDIGLTACFSNGFDGFGRTILQFFSPVLIWINAGIIIFLCSKSSRIAAIVGTNGVKVLATLLLISYTKILQAEVAVFSCARISVLTDQSIATKDSFWLRDATVPCWQGKHLVLVVIGAVFGIATIIYTLILLFVQPLQKYSHLRPLKWVARLKPFIDAYTCPHVIKDRYRFWTGLLLLFRALCVVIFAVLAYKNIFQYNVALIIFICALIFTLVWSFGGIYKSWQLNVLNASFYLNLVTLSTLTWYALTLHDTATDEATIEKANQLQTIGTEVSTIIAVLTFTLIVVYHVCKRLKETSMCSCCVTRLSSTRLWQSLSTRYQVWRERRYQRVPQQEEPVDDDGLEYDRDQDRELRDGFENGSENESEDDEIAYDHGRDRELHESGGENEAEQAETENGNRITNSELLHTYTY